MAQALLPVPGIRPPEESRGSTTGYTDKSVCATKLERILHSLSGCSTCAGLTSAPLEMRQGRSLDLPPVVQWNLVDDLDDSRDLVAG